MVQKDSRREGKLALAVLARMHAKYVMQITSNPKIFDQRYYHAITVDLIRTSKDIYRSIWAANNTLVKSKSDYTARRKYQVRAVMLCNMMLADIEIAQSVFRLKGKRMRYWAGMVIEIRNKARAWIESDAKRYSEYR